MEKYFKKFSIMFVMLLSIIGIGMIQNGSLANAATVGQQLTAPENGWTRYDDADSNIVYTNFTYSSYYENYNGGYRLAQTTGAKVQFKFYGSKIRIIAAKLPNFSNNINIKIDNGISETFSECSSSHIFQELVYEKTNLTLNVHTIEITTNDSVYVGFDAIDIDDTGCLVGSNESITLDKSTMNLSVSDSQLLTAATTPAGAQVTWTSDDTGVATVDSSGKVTAVGAGTATITATMADGSNLSSSCTVNVTNPITPGITLNKTSDSLTIGQTDNLVATTTPSGAQVTWTSSDVNIATVDSTGKITAIKAGTVTITASTPDGVTASATVTVANATGGNVTPTNPTDNSGGTPTGTSNIVNIAYAKGENTNNAGGDVSIIFNGLPDTTLSVVKTADVKSVYVGDTFTYTIVATNTGAKTAKSVVISDSAPNHIQFMPSGITTTQGTVDPSSTSSNILVNVGDIPPLGTVTIKIPATVVM